MPKESTNDALMVEMIRKIEIEKMRNREEK